MLYIQINPHDSNKLSYYCRSCGFRDDTLSEEKLCVMNTQLKRGKQVYNHIVNKYTKLDPTLPRIYTLKCPSGSCKTNTESVANPEVIYIRYDDSNLKYLYMCVECDTTWKTDSYK
jgi:DNA-directed RNA polymerase subunit M/transcription elongation factor TFIIS